MPALMPVQRYLDKPRRLRPGPPYLARAVRLGHLLRSSAMSQAV